MRVHGSYCPDGAPGADAVLDAFLLRPVAPPTRASVARHMLPGRALDGRNVLLVGGSRGLGAALAGTLSTQGATVWIAYHRSQTHVAGLIREFGADQIRPLRCDAADPHALDRAVEPLRARGGIDGLALLATPPLRNLPLHPDATSAHLDFVRDSLALVMAPLSVVGPLLAQGRGWLVAVSSTAVTEPVPHWPHYLAAKAALEALTADFARAHDLPVLVLRAPKMRTDLVNGPTAAIGAVPTEHVAASVVRWAVDAPRAGVTVVVPPPVA
ncbi:SDR family NAD(P)-dependent oxidoreductase [Streptomyces sp. NPDC091371]|uniref:SDR family NAD(P)-dependent oxidoreductase n=1 Tax=Streptomyces sp. NPDC091371 TaxID=3155303 RepID=UPI00343B49E0